jgi:ribosomal protein L32
VALIRRRQRIDREFRAHDSPYAVSTEGTKRCPNCGMYNLWTDRNCISCKRRLPG